MGNTWKMWASGKNQFGGKGRYGLKFPDVLSECRHRKQAPKASVSKAPNSQFLPPRSHRARAAACGRLSFSTSKKQQQQQKTHKNGVSMPNSLSPALMDHCSFLDCASLWEKNLKMVLFRVQQFQHQWKQFTVSQKLQWNRLEYYVNHLSI